MSKCRHLELSHILTNMPQKRAMKAQFQLRLVTPPKTNMDTQNDGLEKVDSFQICRCHVSFRVSTFPDLFPVGSKNQLEVG